MNSVTQTEGTTLGDHWTLTLIMIMIGLWIFLKYLAPKSWKEWRNVGVLQAFIIALYVKMYGFPLTIYILTALLGLGETGAMVEMFIGLGIVVLGITLISRGWYVVYRSQQDNKLVAEGVYSY